MTPYNPEPVLDAVAYAIKGAVAKLDERLDNIVAADDARFADEQQRVEQVRGEFAELGVEFDKLRADTGEMATELGNRIGDVDKGAVDRLKALAAQLDNLDLEVRGTADQRAARDRELDAGLVALRADIKTLYAATDEVGAKSEDWRVDLTASLHNVRELLSRHVAELTQSTEEQGELLIGHHTRITALKEDIAVTDSTLAILEQRLTDAQAKGEGEVESLKAAVDAEQVKVARGLIALGEACDDLDARVLANFKTQSGVGQELHKNLNELRESLDEYRNTVDGVHGRFADDLIELSLQVEEVPEVVEEKVSAVRQELQTQTGALTGALGLHVEETGEQFEEVNESIGALAGRANALDRKFVDWNRTHRDAETWGRGGSAYKEGAIVRHRGGFWQAAETTSAEPGEDVTWRLLADGVHDFGFAQHDERHIVFRLEFASGASVESSPIELPGFNFRSAFDPERTYHRNELVLYRGSIYIVIAAGSVQTDDPANCVGMELFTKRGQRGARGPQGLPGVPPAMDDILRQFQVYMEQGDGTAITVFRGHWNYQETYSRGDVVVFDNSLRICLEQNDGTQPPGGSMGQIGNDDWAMFFAPASASSGTSGAMTWHYPYSPTETYQKNSVVNDTGWLMIANKETADSAAPVATGPTSYIILDDPPAWGTRSDNAVIHSGMVVEFTESGWWEHVRVAVPNVVTNVFTRVGLYNITDPDNIHFYYVNDPQLISGQWSEVVSVAVFVRPGTKYFLFQEVYDDSNETTFNGEWLSEGAGGPDPAIGSWSRTAHSVIYISKIDSNGGGRSAELLSILPSSEIVTQEIADPETFSTYLVNGVITDEGTYFAIPVDRQANSGDPGEGEPSTLYFRVPITAHTDYYQLEEYWPTHQPSWGVVSGRLLLNGVEQTGVEGIAFGVDIDFTPAYVSPDWDVMAVTGDIGSESGGTAGGTLVDYGELSQDLGTLATTLTIDISQGQSVLATLTGDVSTVVFENPSAHAATSFMLLMDTGGFDVLDWSGAVAGWFGAPPDLSSGGTHGFGFELIGGSWYGTHKGQVN